MNEIRKIKSKIYFFITLSLLVFPNFSATDKEPQKKGHTSLMRSVETSPSEKHERTLQGILNEWGLPKSPLTPLLPNLPLDFEEKIKSKLTTLYAHNMYLIGRFEGPEKTPHMDPENWAIEKINTWKVRFAQAGEELEFDDESLDEGVGGTPKTLYEYMIPLAKEEMLELIKDNDELTKSLALQDDS